MARQRSRINTASLVLVFFMFPVSIVVSYILFALVVGGAWGGILAILSLFGIFGLLVVGFIVLLPVEVLVIIALILYYVSTGQQMNRRR